MIQKKHHRHISIIFCTCIILSCLLPMDLNESWASEKVLVGNETVLMDKHGDQAKRGRPAVAFGKDVFLVAWQEGWHGYKGNSRIHSIRVDLDGKIMGTETIQISPSKTGLQENPRIAYYDGVFLIVWQDMRNGKNGCVLGVRLSPQGKVLDDEAIPIAVAERSQVMPEVTADSKGFLVVWHGFQNEENEARIFARRIEKDGSVGKPVSVTHGADPAIAWNGNTHLLVYISSVKNSVGVSPTLRILSMDENGKPFNTSELLIKGIMPHHSVCGIKGKGWIVASDRSVPDFWGWSGPGAQRIYSITLQGKPSTDPPSEKYIDPYTRKKKIPLNWLDTSLGKKNHRAAGPAGVSDVWPWGRSALVDDQQKCVAVWERYHTGGETGVDLVNCDLRLGRAEGWKPLDGEGGIPLATSKAEELRPAIAGNGAGILLCVYEKILEGQTQICARMVKIKDSSF